MTAWLDEHMALLATGEPASPAIRRAVLDCLRTNSAGFDHRDLGAVLNTLTEDAVFRSYRGVSRGRDELRVAYETMLAAFSRTCHLVGTATVRLDGADRTQAVSHVHALVWPVDGPPYAFIASYHDRLRLEGGRWRIAERSVFVPSREPSPA